MKKKAGKKKQVRITVNDILEQFRESIKLLDRHVSIIDRKLNEELSLAGREAIEFAKMVDDVRSLKAETGHHTNRISKLEQYRFSTEKMSDDLTSWGTCIGEIKFTEEEKQKEKNKWLSTFARLFKKS